MTDHDLIGWDTHLKPVAGGLKYCMCWGTCCFDPTTLDCTCETGCDCRSKGSTVTGTRAPMTTTIPSPPAKHTCDTCGVEVFRNGTRGRFPKLCLTCKENK